jgi:hypothetical protein
MLTYAALIWWKKNISDHCKKAVCPYPTHYLIGYVRLYIQTPHLQVFFFLKVFLGLSFLQVVVEKEAIPAACRLHCSGHFKKSDWKHSAIYKKNDGRVSGLTGSI